MKDTLMKDNNRYKFITFLNRFLHNQSTGGIILLACAVISLLVANIPSISHLQRVWDVEAGFTFGDFSLKMTLLQWINDGLMVIFFFVVGLEIKREILVGDLSSSKKAALPIVAAIGGMVVPALIYTIFNNGTPYQNGWGIPMATDIAFAIGILSLLGKRCPTSLKVFLTAIAIVDDIGAIFVIAIFYPTHEIQFIYLLSALVVVAVLFIFNRMKVRYMAAYIIPGLFLWYFIYSSGVHATVAGVILAALIPSKTSLNELRFQVRMSYLLGAFKEVSNREVEVLANPTQMSIIQGMKSKIDKISPMIHNFETMLHPLSSFIIMPLFALANAGVAIEGSLLSTLSHPIGIGIFLGLFLGKPLGIFLFSYFAVKFNFAELPTGAKFKQILAIGVVAGIGFTMAIFIDNLAFTEIEYVNIGKVAIILTSVISALFGLAAIYFTTEPVAKTRHKKRKH